MSLKYALFAVGDSLAAATVHSGSNFGDAIATDGSATAAVDVLVLLLLVLDEAQ